ncbi:MAG: 2,3-bisphosphoglycerate-dependent phosphoglycerate mutase [Rickettsiales bacterium]|nr:2,3-bisphosphoglycerate-dependent phosphoglycerate mutase [Rickettsiales bacterium]
MMQAGKVQKMGRLIIIRHGESEFNRDDLFAGWVDTPLTEAGRNGAIEAGKLIRKSGFQADAVYTTRLSRAQDTTKEILKGLGQASKACIESDALLERHYGNLAGLKKEETRAARKGEPYIDDPYTYPPPPIEVTNPHHPDHPSDAIKVIDVPGNMTKGESIKDVEDRVRPLWLDDILPRLQRGENVLISAHANTLRALNKIIQKLPPEQLKDTQVPNATPVEIVLDSVLGTKEWEFQSRAVVDGKGPRRQA